MAVTSDTDICNLALLDLGGSRISSLDESTKEGLLCLAFYGPTRDELLRSHPWNFAVKRVELTYDTDQTPAFEYDYAFPLPSDFLRLIRTSLQADGYDDDDYRIEYGTDGSVLLSNESTVKIEYVARVTDVSRYDPLFVALLAKSLAVKLCMNLADNANLKKQLVDEMREIAPAARLVDATDGKPREIVGYDWVTARV